MRCSTIITCELLNYTVQRQVNGQATESTIKLAQSDADKQVMTDKLVRNSKHVKKDCHSSRQEYVHHNTGCLKESKQNMVTREAGKPVNIAMPQLTS